MGIKQDSSPTSKRMNPLVFLAKHRRVLTVHRKGSGFFANNKGLIVTNAHIINKAKKIIVTTFDKKEYDAEIVKIFNDKDLAFIKISSKTQYKKLLIATNTKNISLSEVVYTIGSSTINKGTFIEGKIIGLGRQGDEIALLKTQISLYSGAPLLDAGGALIGLLYAKGYGMKNYTLAIPSSTIKNRLEDYTS